MADRDPETGRFLTGNGGGGRPKGSRNKLGEQFLEALAQDFAEYAVRDRRLPRGETDRIREGGGQPAPEGAAGPQ